MAQRLQIDTVEMHTGGEPVRIVVGGYPRIEGGTILEKRRYARESLDSLRKLLMREPRGHPDMYGVLPVEPDHPEAQLAVLFMHNEGYSTMCGHAALAMGRFAIDRGLVPAVEPETEVRLQCPCGLVRVLVEVRDGEPGRARFRSVPAFAFALSKVIETPEWGPLELDIGFGGAFYAVLPAASIGLDVRSTPASRLADAGAAISEAIARQVTITHPSEPDLGFLYGTILTDGREQGGGPSANACVFAGRQVDRSPTGSGVTTRLALQHRRGQVALGEERVFESVTGSRFSGRIVEETRLANHPAVVVEVAGESHYSGEGRFTLEAGDPFPEGFLLS